MEATIYCDAPVASRRRRIWASVLDGIVVLIAVTMCFVLFCCGPPLVGYERGEIILTWPASLLYVAAVALMFLFYKLLACLLAEQTPGMKWMGLRLLNFDGRSPDIRQRLIRLVSSCLSGLPACAGLLWALLDEERLGWHDHMSKTFATRHESGNLAHR